MAAGLNAAHHPFPTETTPRREAKPKLPTASPILGLHASAKLREQLLAEVKELGSGEDAANWANRNLAAKNRLRPSDAAQVEALFAAKLATIATSSVAGTTSAHAGQGRVQPSAQSKWY